MALVLLVTFLVFLLLDIPVAFCMILSSLAALLYHGINPIMVGLETVRSLSTFYSFLAVPFFILAGELMSQGGLSRQLIRFVQSLVGHRRSGLPMVTTISSQLFGSVSGASNATCAAIGGIMIPALVKHGYSRPFATALSACSGTTGALIPPSIVLLIYGTISGVSIEKLFVAGVGPGILVGAGLITVSWWHGRKVQVPVLPKAGFKQIISSAGHSVLAIFMIIIIFGGIMGGIFTATEASAVAVVYALFIGLVVYRQIKISDLPKVFVSAAKTTATLSFLIATASLFAWTLGIGKVPEVLTQTLIKSCETIIGLFGNDLDPNTFAFLRKIVVLLTLNIALLFVGMFIDAGPGLLIVVPVLIPVSQAIGMGSGLAAVHFGVLVVANLIIGLVTPPVGTTLFVASAVGKVQISEMVPHVLRFLVVMVVVQLLVTYVPAITITLPGFME
jgi:C4-dicarboxylate transporter DctM subunit